MTDGLIQPRPWLASYCASIPQELPALKYQSLADLVQQAAATHGKRKAFTCVTQNGMNGTLSFDKVGQLSDAFAAFLHHECGLKPGDRVAVQLPNGLPYPIVAFGVFKAGCVLVNTNPLYTPSEMIHQFNDSGAKVLVIVDMFADKLAEVIPKTGIQTVVLAGVPEFFPKFPEIIIRGVQKVWSKTSPPVPSLAVPVLRLKSALAKGQARGMDTRTMWGGLRPDDLAMLQYTGATTGVAKGAMLSHGNILNNLAQMQAVSGGLMSPDDCVLTALPLYHIFAFTANLMDFFSRLGRAIS